MSRHLPSLDRPAAAPPSTGEPAEAAERAAVFQRKKRRRRRFRVTLLLLMALLLAYTIYGTIGPYIGNPPVSRVRQNRFSTADFYGSDDSDGSDRVRLLTTGSENLAAALNLIDSAVESIRLVQYETLPGNAASTFGGALLRAADRGVQVEWLTDGAQNAERQDFFRILASDNRIHIRQYRPIQYLLPWTYNSRLRDSFMIADDRLAWFGDPISSGSAGDEPRQSGWNLLVYNNETNTRRTANSVISELTNYFTALWSSENSQEVFHIDRSNRTNLLSQTYAGEAAAWMTEWDAKRSANRAYQSALSEYMKETSPTRRISLIKNPVNSINKEPYIWFELTQLMKQARHRVLVAAPTVMLSPSMLDDLRQLTGSIESFKLLTGSANCSGSDKKRADYRINRKDILKTGLQLYEDQTPSAFLARSVLIDDDLTVLGNYDISLSGTYLNTGSLMVVHSPELNQSVQQKLDDWMQDARQVKPDGSYNAQGSASILEPVHRNPSLQYFYGLLLQLFRTLI